LLGLAYIEWTVLLLSSLALGLAVIVAIRSAMRRAVRRATPRIARAYVTISCPPPGLTTDEPPREGSHASESQELRVAIEVRNRGNTPANVSAWLLTCHVGHPLPEQPPYERARASQKRIYLPTDGCLRLSGSLAVSAKDVAMVRSGDSGLWVFGYVDYRSAFGARYRSGFVRRWNPRSPDSGNNLVIESKPRYDYDRERENGEGSD
jgi:hypothetical protein